MAGAVMILLAAGRSERMKTSLPKPLHRACGRALLEYALDAAESAGMEGVAVVAPADSPGVEALAAGRAVCVPGGDDLGASLSLALAQLPAYEPVVIAPCDIPQLQGEHLAHLVEAHRRAATEASELFVGGSAAGVYAARREAVLSLNADATADALFPRARRVDLAGEPLIDVDTRGDLARAEKALRRIVADRLMDQGVTIIDPDRTYIDAGVQVGSDTVIYPGVLIEGRTVVGRRCTIGPQAHLVDCTLADEVFVEASVVRDSRIGARVSIGPFANIRPGCEVGEGTKIGDYVELKKSQIGDHVSIAHLSYVGDASVGSHVNIGAGVITCNYDGFHKNRTVIGDNAFVGSNSVLIAPVTIGPGAYVAAHSAISQNVPADALGIARARQENKEDWARRRRQARGKD